MIDNVSLPLGHLAMYKYTTKENLRKCINFIKLRCKVAWLSLTRFVSIMKHELDVVADVVEAAVDWLCLDSRSISREHRLFRG